MEIGDPRSLKSDINVTPLVDVMLVMLIIFMLVTPMLQKGMGVSLPEARNVAPVSENEEQTVVVVLQQNGTIHVGNEAVDRKGLVTALRRRQQEFPGVQLQVKADRNARFADVRKLVQAGREAGFESAALVANEIKDERSDESLGGE